jgi:hypothetical protein
MLWSSRQVQVCTFPSFCRDIHDRCKRGCTLDHVVKQRSNLVKPDNKKMFPIGGEKIILNLLGKIWETYHFIFVHCLIQICSIFIRDRTTRFEFYRFRVISQRLLMLPHILSYNRSIIIRSRISLIQLDRLKLAIP